MAEPLSEDLRKRLIAAVDRVRLVALLQKGSMSSPRP
jgi:hypothetical protein